VAVSQVVIYNEFMEEKKIQLNTLSVELDAALHKRFSEHVHISGDLKYKAIEAAFKAYLALDPSIQAKLQNMEIDETQAKTIIETFYSDLASMRALESLTPVQRAQLLLDAKQSRDKVFRKK
jgi:hypothetical protein